MKTRHRRRSAPWVVCGLALLLSGCEFSPGKVDAIVHADDARPRLLPTRSGPVEGVASARGQAFLGIPYAAAPVGPLRWRAPQPPASWTEPRPARDLGESCLQNLSLDAQTGKAGNGPFIGAEDCLTLNVYAPGDARPGQRRPVMVWVYGGAFVLGTSGQYDPSLLAARTGVIVVTFNYRLGALGFLAHPALRGQPGEGAFALLDQQAALRWVRDNIAGIGGDPRRVTLFGQSAGAWSTCDQMAAPGAAGLFSRAILQSGACMTPETSIPVEAAERGGVLMAEDLGCTGDKALACLRDRPAKQVLAALPWRRGVVGPNSWAPSVGLDVLPKAPREAFLSGRFNRVPVIDGTNRDEGRLFSYLRGYQGDLWTGGYETAITTFFGDRAAKILAEYPVTSFASPSLAYAAVLTDSLFACAARSLDEALARWTAVYAYEFGDGRAPFSLPPTPWSGGLGAFHTAEIASVFGTPWILADPGGFDEGQTMLSARMQAAWGVFAAKGDPNAPGLVVWPRFASSGEVEDLSPDRAGTIGDFAERHRCAFWVSLGY